MPSNRSPGSRRSSYPPDDHDAEPCERPDERLTLTFKKAAVGDEPAELTFDERLELGLISNQSLAEETEGVGGTFEDGGLAIYMRRIANHPRLSAADEVRLAKEIEAGGVRGEAARQEFIEANYGLVVSIAKRYHYEGMTLLDHINAGNVGLMRAVDKFDWRRGLRFSTFAHWWIRGEITDDIARTQALIHIPKDQRPGARPDVETVAITRDDKEWVVPADIGKIDPEYARGWPAVHWWPGTVPVPEPYEKGAPPPPKQGPLPGEPMWPWLQSDPPILASYPHEEPASWSVGSPECEECGRAPIRCICANGPSRTWMPPRVWPATVRPASVPFVPMRPVFGPAWPGARLARWIPAWLGPTSPPGYGGSLAWGHGQWHPVAGGTRSKGRYFEPIYGERGAWTDGLTGRSFPIPVHRDAPTVGEDSYDAEPTGHDFEEIVEYPESTFEGRAAARLDVVAAMRTLSPRDRHLVWRYFEDVTPTTWTALERELHIRHGRAKVDLLKAIAKMAEARGYGPGYHENARRPPMILPDWCNKCAQWCGRCTGPQESWRGPACSGICRQRHFLCGEDMGFNAPILTLEGDLQVFRLEGVGR